MRLPFLVALLALALPCTAAAQELRMLEGLFKSLNSFTLAVHSGQLQGSRELNADCGVMGLCGMGTEVFINLADTENAIVELALGTSFLRGFSAREPTLDLRGAIRSFPTISIYATRKTMLGQDLLEPYAGLNLGMVDLWNVQAYDLEGREYALKAQTYEFGAVGGLMANFGSLNGLFLEAGYKNRRFSSVDWTFPPGVDRVPAKWPRELDMSGWTVSMGYQVSLERGGQAAK